MITGCHIIEPRNLGDKMCCPLDYFEEWKDVPRRHIDDVPNIEGDVVFGGGGILFPDFMPILEQCTERRSGKYIVWGAGMNLRGFSTVLYPPFLSKFDLVGLRDYGNPWNYVPCASCLHPAFDHKIIPTRDIVIYEHWEHPIALNGFPRMENNQPKDFFSSVISFLGSAETVITNTFHGLYWSLLLGRKVVVWRPFSNRFYSLHAHVQMCDETNWKDAVKATFITDGFFDECRTLNMEFYKKVKEITES